MYVEVTNNQITQRVKVGGAYKNISFGVNADESEYLNAGLYKLVENKSELGVNQKYGSQTISIDEDTKTVTTDLEIIDFTLEEIEETYRNKIQEYMDAQALERGYDNIFTAITYVGDDNETYNTEGTAFKAWRSAVWTYCYEQLALVTSGDRELPTVEEFILELPSFGL